MLIYIVCTWYKKDFVQEVLREESRIAYWKWAFWAARPVLKKWTFFTLQTEVELFHRRHSKWALDLICRPRKEIVQLEAF